MTVFVQDSFTDTDNTTLQTHTPDVGGTWEATNIGTPDTTNAVVFSTNVLRSGVQGDSTRIYRNAATPDSAEYDVQAVWGMGEATNEFRTWGLYGRMTPTGVTDSAVDRYQVQYKGDATEANRRWLLQKVVGGVVTTLDQLNQDESGNTLTVKLEIRNATKRVLRNGVQILTSNDNEVTQVGRAGVSTAANRSANHTDDFLAETIAAATVTAQISHGLVLGHAVVVEQSVTVHAAHGLVLGHQIHVAQTVTADVTHGLILGHQVVGDVEEETVTVAVEHGLVLGHQVQAEVDIITGTVNHGLVLGHAVAGASQIETSVAHGLILGHRVDGQILVAVAVAVSHGLVLGHQITGHSGAIVVGRPIQPLADARPIMPLTQGRPIMPTA